MSQAIAKAGGSHALPPLEIKKEIWKGVKWKIKHEVKKRLILPNPAKACANHDFKNIPLQIFGRTTGYHNPLSKKKVPYYCKIYTNSGDFFEKFEKMGRIWEL